MTRQEAANNLRQGLKPDKPKLKWKHYFFFSKLWGIAFQLLLLGIILIATCCGLIFYEMSFIDSTFRPHLYEASIEADKLLLDYGICNETAQCRKFYYWQSGRGGGEVGLFGVREQKVVAEFSQIFANKFIQTSDMYKLTIKAYLYDRKTASKTSFFNDKPFFDLRLEKNK